MQGPTFPLSIFIITLKTVIFVPLLPFTIKFTLHKLSKKTLILSDHCTLTMRQSVLEESIVIEVIREVLTVAFTLKIDYLASVEGSIRHRRKFILQQILPIIIA